MSAIIVSAVALDFVTDNKTLSWNNFTSEERTAIESLNIDSLSYNDTLRGDKVFREFDKIPRVRVPITWMNCSSWSFVVDDTNGEESKDECLQFDTIEFTSEEINDMLDVEQIRMLKIQAHAKIQRDARVVEEIRGGDVVIR